MVEPRGRTPAVRPVLYQARKVFRRSGVREGQIEAKRLHRHGRSDEIDRRLRGRHHQAAMALRHEAVALHCRGNLIDARLQVGQRIDAAGIGQRQRAARHGQRDAGQWHTEFVRHLPAERVRRRGHRLHDRDRRGALHQRVVADLAVGILAPALQPAVGHRAAMGGTAQPARRHDGRDRRQFAHANRPAAVGEGPVAELAVCVPAHAGSGATFLHHARVHKARAEGVHGGNKPVHGNRRQALDGRPVAELAVVIVAPAGQRPGRIQRTGVAAAGINRPYDTQPVHDDRRTPIDACAIAELAGVVVAPAAHGAVIQKCARVSAAGCQPLDPGEAAHVHRQAPEGGGVVAELAGCVAAPTGRRTIGAAGTGMGIACRHRSCLRQAAHGHRLRPQVGGAVAKLAVVVASPAEHVAATRHRACVVTTDGDGLDARCQANDRDGDTPVRARAVAKLAVAVGAPAPDRALAGQETGVGLARRHGHHRTVSGRAAGLCAGIRCGRQHEAEATRTQ